jgi:hypothetical protein
MGNKTLTTRGLFGWLLAGWVVVNLLQAAFTGISNDEAYYALWGQHLDWGYFDHPPMVALFTFLSSLLAPGALGVRLMTVLAQALTLWLVWRLLKESGLKKSDDTVLSFFIVAASLVMVAALGFVTTPDVPLLLFAALFLLNYRRFLQRANWANLLLLGLSMAGMVYSKYQSVLVIGFIVLSNPRLLLNLRFWLSGLLALLLLAPHVYWQYLNDFPSFQYHLVARSAAFKWAYFLEFLPNQLAVFNPLTLGLVIYVLVKRRSADVFERGLRFVIVGFLLFFWVMAFRGHVEPHWTVVASLPMLILLVREAAAQPRVRRFIHTWVLGSLGLVLLARVALLIPATAAKAHFYTAPTYEAIAAVAGDVPVVFGSSFQKPSLYTFHSGRLSTTVSSINNRRTQFDLWQWERGLEGQRVFVCANIEGRSQVYTVGDQRIEGFFVESFRATQRLVVTTDLPESGASAPGDTVRATVTVTNPYPYAVQADDSVMPVRVVPSLFTRKVKRVCEVVPPAASVGAAPVWSAPNALNLAPGASLTAPMVFVVPDDMPAGTYNLTVTTEGLFGPALGNRLHAWKVCTQN